MKSIIFFLLILSSYIFSRTPKTFITEKQFRKRISNHYILKFLRTRNCCLNLKEKRYIIQTANRFKINPMLILGKMQGESSVIDGGRDKRKYKYMAMGIEKKWAYGFYRQVWYACKTLDYHFRNAHTKKFKVYVYDLGKKIKLNRAAYALFKYCPWWYAKPAPYEFYCGNRIFYWIFRKYNRKIKKIIKKNSLKNWEGTLLAKK